jgi:hypothetical protein
VGKERRLSLIIHTSAFVGDDTLVPDDHVVVDAKMDGFLPLFFGVV